MDDKQIVEYIELDFDSVINTKINASAFKKGVDTGSFLNGIVSSLFNSGLEAENITQIICELIKKDIVK